MKVLLGPDVLLDPSLFAWSLRRAGGTSQGLSEGAGAGEAKVEYPEGGGADGVCKAAGTKAGNKAGNKARNKAGNKAPADPLQRAVGDNFGEP